jgi:F-type H+-transporting ATPase subunit b
VKKILALSILLVSAAAAAAQASGAPAGHGAIPWDTIVKQAVNFAILVAVLVYFLRKPLSSFLQERTDLLKKSIDDAARARQEAAEKLAAIEARLAKLPGELEELSRRSASEADAEARRIAEAGKVEADRIRLQAETSADLEVRKAREELRREASELAAQAAEELLKREFKPSDQERLVRENIEKIREIVR